MSGAVIPYSFGVNEAITQRALRELEQAVNKLRTDLAAALTRVTELEARVTALEP
jgi:polyhydroxyalkanoate synthesis regulator phasin